MGAGALAEDRWDHVEGTSTRSVESLIWARRRKPGESGEMMRKAQREAGDRAAITSRSAQSGDSVPECLPAIIRCDQPPATTLCLFFPMGGHAFIRSKLQILSVHECYLVIKWDFLSHDPVCWTTVKGVMFKVTKQ
ncbi:hypothetical protein AXG93_885s1020 [Marchantia polymorpha subsp. ruderalis]|uniref:Uncharacterized protein n=1 Tax=Marchantia polymorpha subsp. ruderalis TaxID=1480154 RepID=A0A176WEZ9_MARPO|nr:hypothetical protein AXG93_885s1020 [Marchantia polymorpha subsp. ruderalis]